MAGGKGTVNKVILIGRLGQDPELRYTPSGAAVANFSIATNLVWKDQEGTQREKTEWHRIVVWRKLAEIAGEYLKKGKLVYVEGRLQTRSWNDQNDITRYTTEVIADSFQMLGAKGDRVDESAGPPPPSDEMPEADQSESPPEQSEDDLPF